MISLGSPTLIVPRFILRHAPTLATSHSPLLIALSFVLNFVIISWSIFVPVSFTNLPDLQQSFLTLYVICLGAIALWLSLPRHFSVSDRFGARNVSLEVLDFSVMIICLGLVLFAPFANDHILSTRISALASTAEVTDDIAAVQHAACYPIFRRAWVLYNRAHYWGESATADEPPKPGVRLDGVLGVEPAFELIARANANVSQKKNTVIAADISRFLEVLHRYSPNACSESTKDASSMPVIIADIFRFDQLPVPATRGENDQQSERDRLLERYRCMDPSDVIFGTGQLLLSKGSGPNRTIYRLPLLPQYSAAVAVYAACFVFLMGSLTQRYLLWLAPKLAFLTFLLPGFHRYYPRSTAFEMLAPLSRLGPVLISCLYVYAMFLFLQYRRRGLSRTARDYISATLLSCPAVFFLAANMYAAFAALFAVVLGRGYPTDAFSGSVFLQYIEEQEVLIRVLALAAFPYAVVAFWLRNSLIRMKSAPREY